MSSEIVGFNLGSQTGLWFDRLASSLKLPSWLGILVVITVPTVAFWVLGTEIGIATAYTGIPALSLPLLIAYVMFLTGASLLVHARSPT